MITNPVFWFGIALGMGFTGCVVAVTSCVVWMVRRNQYARRWQGFPLEDFK